MLYSEDVNKKTRIQNALQSKKAVGGDNSQDKIDYKSINKYNPDLAVNVNKYMDDDLIALKKKAIFKSLKNYLGSLEENKEKNKKKKVYRIKKRKSSDAPADAQNIREEVENTNADNKNSFNDLEGLSRNAYRKSLLIRLYGFYLGNLVFEKIFSKYKF